MKNSTRKQYEESFKRHLLPEFGSSKLNKLSTVELQAYFNSLHPKPSPKAIRLIHGTLRAALNQGIAWGMLSKKSGRRGKTAAEARSKTDYIASTCGDS